MIQPLDLKITTKIVDEEMKISTNPVFKTWVKDTNLSTYRDMNYEPLQSQPMKYEVIGLCYERS